MTIYAINADNITKVYRLYEKPIDRLKEALNPFCKHYFKEFYALKNISFQVNSGERLGIIGPNGSGKSTLLKIFTGILTPTNGIVQVNGKVSALLELGAGFNPEYTGIENIYLNGAIMGYSKEEMNAKLEEIISFADIGAFINQPVKIYSSGMFARLAFALAVNIDPDILIVDEILSVGDSLFQEKSFNKMKAFQDKGKTIIFVSHNLPSIRNFCDRAIWLQNGEIRADGKSDEVCELYQDFLNEKMEKVEVTIKPELTIPSQKKISIKNAVTDREFYCTGDDIIISGELDFFEEVGGYGIGILIYNSKGELVTLFNTIRDDLSLDKAHHEFKLIIPQNDFLKDTYYITVSISDEMVMFPYDKRDYITSFSINSKKNKQGIPIADGYFRSKHQWEF